MQRVPRSSQRGGIVAKRPAGLTAAEGVLGAPEQRLTAAYACSIQRATVDGPNMKEPCRGGRQGSKASKTREKVRGSLMECCSLDGADQAGSGSFSTPGGASHAPSAARF